MASPMRMIVGFLSTLSLRRATFCVGFCLGAKAISIHALLAESDMFAGVLSHYSRISIHALLAESDISVFWTALSRPLFLSTLSLRRATHYDNYNLHCVEISIHALLAESDAFFLMYH